MSSLHRPVMHDEGTFAAAAGHHHHGSLSGHASHGAHAGHAPAAVNDQGVPCPYEAKVVASGTTARMVLMFLRELVEHMPHSYHQFQQFPHQQYTCPMMKCYQTFEQPFMLIQHLLDCPELPNGEFDCDKCNNWHEFPTNEKDWSLWSGWLWKSQRNNHQQQGDNIQRKRSFSSKMRDTFLRKKDPSRKQNLADHSYSSDTGTRPGTATSGVSSINTLSRCPEHQHMSFSSHTGGQSFSELHKPVVPTGAPQIEDTMFWPVDTDMSDLRSDISSIAPSTINRSSIAPSTFDTETPKGLSTANTSQTTIFNPLAFQSPASDVLTPPFLYTPQPFNDPSLRLGVSSSCPSAMSIDEPMKTEPALSPTELGPATPNDSRTWWGSKPEIDTPRPTPASSPFYPMDQPMMHTMSRTLSQESMQTAISGLYQQSMAEGTQMDSISPHSEHSYHAHHGPGMGIPGRAGSPTEELVCDECQWKPRGVRENLRGYLRKHKNTHKGLRLPCDVVGCTKTFSRLDNLKKHKKDKHGIDEPGGVLPLKRVVEEYEEGVEEEPAEHKRSGISDADIRSASGDYSMLWPALHF